MQNIQLTLPNGIVQCNICGCFQPPCQVNTDEDGIHTCIGGHASHDALNTDEHLIIQSQPKQNA